MYMALVVVAFMVGLGIIEAYAATEGKQYIPGWLRYGDGSGL